ncbi:MAG TPA: pyruvate:ferredoxin (flavodoxin) oxidoreductase [Treponemataceae bacterium]|nr:pyruvate:ferredoxin (flavodoxin) oxidoreductase [Treponemataceae bacterium]HOS34328.1 pyruvate:ferredoxin (flavodoxin) oxidoreductase [Treponemataceae bacterium]HPL90576.1 pyruvate:ferredoxin (flavodoxin) oxidoreductase [Treponemataceae bacterium]HQF73455.1 pyruvate:ferredoxin (flavodoxin) oxidoreductase [Treponemataceae bacterium]HRR02171.1 pyruvate:ferredoxin (flavodoxin) oxidoreductase [Treponemataceae bacterium]
MSEKNLVMIDGNTAAGHVAHALSEVIAIYPITPSSPMGEVADEYSAKGKKNIWGTVPDVVELQSEGGASGAVHGALTTGALSSTFTASQGLLLMIPNMYKIAGELTSTVFHIAARAIAASALSIFGDHSDVMACRQTGWAMLSSNNVQEVMDLAVISHAATLESRIPFLHFFDGFRTSHEIQKIEEVSYETMQKMIDNELVRAHRARGLTPENPAIRGTAQNPDVYFQGREAVNKYYLEVPAIVQKAMDKYAKLTGRQYKLYEYVGPADADRVIIIMGSGADTVEETVEALNAKGEKVGVLKVRLYRPFSAELFVKALPATVKAIAVLDRTKEPGSLGEPLYEDVRTAIGETQAAGTCPFKDFPLVLGGRYGLGSKEFTPAMVKAVFDNLVKGKKANFTIGIEDDVTGNSLSYDASFQLEDRDMHQAMFFGLGSDGTVGANKNSIKIIGEATDNKAQAYFVYDSKKSGSITTSHLRFGKHAIRKPYLVTQADFVACHKFTFLEKYDMLANAKKGGTFLLTSPYGKDDVWNHLPVEVQKQIIDKDLKFYVIDAVSIAEKAGMGGRINVVMQTAFFKISGILPEAEAVSLIKKFIEKSYGKKGADVVKKNIDTIDMALAGVEKVDYPKTASSSLKMLPAMTADAPDFIKNILGTIAVNKGDDVKVSEFPEDGTFPSASTQYEKRAIAERMPIWEPDLCIQCGQCTMVCPHAVIRAKAFDPAELKNAPASFKSADYKTKEFPGWKFTIQASAEDCTGCGLCVQQCPAKSKDNPEFKAINMKNFAEHREEESANWKFFFDLPDPEVDKLNLSNAKFIAMKRPLFEFSGACAGCGETPYVKLLSQLYGDRAVIANATGCSSIYGGNLPSTPYAKNAAGQGPAWSNSLFEDAAEFGYGMRLTSDKLAVYAREVAAAVKAKGIAAGVIDRLLANEQADDMAIETQRKDIEVLKKELASSNDEQAKELASLADHFVKRSVWVIGGDGWAYDIGYGGLDHVLASGRNINVLVLDTEVYSNTGGQMSKATPIGAVAKFAAGGKDTSKKDLGMMAMSYGYVYVAKISMGANMNQVIKAFREAESYDGPSLIIAYSHCINHGINMEKGMTNQKEAVTTGLWPLYRFDPRLADEGKNPFQLDSKEPDYNIADFMYKEVRFKTLKAADPARAEMLLKKAEAKVKRQWQEYKYLADRPF